MLISVLVSAMVSVCLGVDGDVSVGLNDVGACVCRGVCRGVCGPTVSETQGGAAAQTQ